MSWAEPEAHGAIKGLRNDSAWTVLSRRKSCPLHQEQRLLTFQICSP